MPAANFYLGVKRGDPLNIGVVNAGTTTFGTAADVEIRIQTNDGSNPTGITREDVINALCKLEAYIAGGGLNHAGTYLPVL